MLIYLIFMIIIMNEKIFEILLVHFFHSNHFNHFNHSNPFNHFNLSNHFNLFLIIINYLLQDCLINLFIIQ